MELDTAYADLDKQLQENREALVKKNEAFKHLNSQLDKQGNGDSKRKTKTKSPPADPDATNKTKGKQKNDPALGNSFDILNSQSYPKDPNPAANNPPKAPKAPTPPTPQNQPPLPNNPPAPSNNPPAPKKSRPQAGTKDPVVRKDFENFSVDELEEYISKYESQLHLYRNDLRNPSISLTTKERTYITDSIQEFKDTIKKLRELLVQKGQPPVKNPGANSPASGTNAPSPQNPPHSSGQANATNVQLNQPNQPTMPTAPESGTPTIEAPVAFDIKSALNKKGFLEFLDEYQKKHGGDYSQEIEEGNFEEVETIFTAYTKSERAKTEIANIFNGEFGKELGKTLTPTEIEEINIYITQERLNNIEGVAELIKVTEEQIETKKLIAAKESEIKAFEADLKKRITANGGEEGIKKIKDEALAKEASIIKKQIDLRRLNPDSTSWSQRRELAKKQGKNSFFAGFWSGRKLIEEEIENIEEEITELEAGLTKHKEIFDPIDTITTKIEEIKDLKADFEQQHQVLKSIIIEAVDSDRRIRKAVEKRIITDLDAVLNPTDPTKRTLKQAETQQEFLDRLKESDFFRGELTDADIEAKQKELDATIKAELNEEIDTVLAGFKPDQSNAFNTLEKGLKPFFDEKRISKLGSREGDEARDFIIETIEEKRTQVGTPKSYLLALLIRNLRNPVDTGNN